VLKIVDLKKDYQVADESVHALKGISVNFRKSEFVSILGPSGCGKTTLLNIIGGLDKYTSGDLMIAGKSTKTYTDRDWDTYRNHSIGFIFQSYHLIPHQTILQNVELALMIAGVSKEERRERAIEALDKVGLKDKIRNKPNQLSGGQAQRVAIARALINDPEIVLADEPTGALDSVTSVQIMELLKEIAKDRLVIMVTHNPELAEKYSTRIVRLLDGEIVDDSKPYSAEEEQAERSQNVGAAAEEVAAEGEQPEKGGFVKSNRTSKGKKEHASMSLGMAFGLSLTNLLSKRRRTAMVSVAGSIGIIGVSMVLAISNGVQNYINTMENDMLSGYPLTVTETAIDYDTLLSTSETSLKVTDIPHLKDKVYVNSLLETLMSFNSSMSTNVITQEYKDYVDAMPSEYYNALQYGYGTDLSNYIYTDYTYKNADGETVTKNTSITAIRSIYTSVLKQQPDYADYADMISSVDSLSEVPDNYEYILSQYNVLAYSDGDVSTLKDEDVKQIFADKSSLIMVVDSQNQLSDLNFGQYGYMTQDEFIQFAFKAQGAEYDKEVIEKYNGIDFSAFIGENAHSFTFYPNDSIYYEIGDDEEFILNLGVSDSVYTGAMLKNLMGVSYAYRAYSDGMDESAKSQGVELNVKLILQKKDGVNYGCLDSGIYYTTALTDYMRETSLNSGIAQYIANSEDGSLPMVPYSYEYSYPDSEDSTIIHDSKSAYYIMDKSSSLSLSSIISSFMGSGSSDSSSDMLKVTARVVGAAELPNSISIYPVDFSTKDNITDYLDAWNNVCTTEGATLTYTAANGISYTYSHGDETDGTYLSESSKITYTDSVGLIIGMVNTMIQIVTIALVAFTALSLVVSTVMIGIITYVSVVERIKEIGILRAVGARKKDIKHLFNAETFIIGLAAGLFGILITYILSLITNIIVSALAGFWGIAALPWWQAVIMVVLSVALTLISGLIPASAAAKKDPVVALRTE